MPHLTAEIVLIAFCIITLIYMARGAIFVPTHMGTVQAMVAAANIKPMVRVADIGSGDGRIVIAFAQAGALATGFEINPLLAVYSRFRIKKLGLASRAHIILGDFWRHDLREFEVVIVFGIHYIMDKLESKLLSESKPGTLVISNGFPFKNLREVGHEGSLFMYRI